MTTWHAIELPALEAELGTGSEGLTVTEADDRLRVLGPNEIVEKPPPPAWLVFLRQFQSPLIYILLAAAVMTVLLGSVKDALVIGMVLVLNAIVGFVQERRAEASVRALKRLMEPKTRVVRGGVEREIESRQLVTGDRVMLESGMRVPADLRLASTNGLLADESILTGESMVVPKSCAVGSEGDEVAGRKGMVFAGSVVASGRGAGYVVATAGHTELGKIASSIQDAERTRTPLEQRMARFARQVSVVAVVACALVFALGTARGEPLFDMLLGAIALAVAAVPEALPAVFTITLAIGVQRMAKRHAVIRRLGAVETLGSTTVIASDKTGTLTENRMTVVEVWSPSEREDTDAGALRTALLTSEAYVDGGGFRGDPTEVALFVAAVDRGLDPEQERRTRALLADLPFEPERQYSASLRLLNGARHLFAKGAPERILAMCHRDRTVDERVSAQLRRMTEKGLRVLAVADGSAGEAPAEARLAGPRGLEFRGLIGMHDPPRAGVKEAIEGCQRAGIRVLMMTGDHAVTAAAIGRELGLIRRGERAERVLTGKDLDATSDGVLEQQLGEAAVLARVSPQHKLRIVQLLRHRGEVVAVTGDGVNDAPALKAADIGIAMGRGGTDVAREASDMVLTDDNFVSIHSAVEEGRVTFDNLRKVTFFLLCTGAAEIFAVLGAQALGWPLPMLPVQLLWLNLVTNSITDLALAFEKGDPDILAKPPRPRSDGILSRILWERLVLAGLVMTVGTLVLFHLELAAGGSIVRARTVALTTMVLFQMFQVGMARSETASAFVKSPFSNRMLLGAALLATCAHALALWIPVTQSLLHLEAVEPAAWLRMVLVAATIIPAMELHKWVRRWRVHRVGEEQPL